MSWWNRIRRGDPRKLSRLHDFEGRLVPPAGWLYAPACLGSTLAFKTFGRRPRIPWLGYRAIARLKALIRPDWNVLEMGGGGSSPWFADRCASLTTIESDQRWYAAVSSLLAGRDNVVLRLSLPPYTELHAELPPTYDFALVDGLARDRAMEIALSKVRPGGFVYLDNSDVQDEQHQRAKALVMAAAESESAITRFVDFSHSHVTVTQGLLVRLR